MNRHTSDESDELGAALRVPVLWTRTADIRHPFAARVNDRTWQVRIGEFPEEPLYTLIVDGMEIGPFNAWPETWQRPANPAR